MQEKKLPLLTLPLCQNIAIMIGCTVEHVLVSYRRSRSKTQPNDIKIKSADYHSVSSLLRLSSPITENHSIKESNKGLAIT
jgi:hypothetical protein